MLAQLEEKIVRLEELSGQQQDGYLTRHPATVRQREIRRKIHHELLRHLVTIADLADAEQPGMAQRFPSLQGEWSNEAFRTIARKLLVEGQAQRELLARHGLGDTLLGDLTAAVDPFDASVADSNLARRTHVGARADLKAVSNEIVRLVEALDGINRYRFSGNTELRAAWDSARNVVSGPGKGGPGGGCAGREARRMTGGWQVTSGLACLVEENLIGLAMIPSRRWQ